jgi:hypothetical protein
MINLNNYSSGNFSQDLENAIQFSLDLENAIQLSKVENSSKEVSSKDEKPSSSSTAKPAATQVTDKDSSLITLPPLTTKQREATIGKGLQYSLWFRSKCAEYHRSGDTWQYKDLELFFVQGLLRHYISETIGYQFDYNYAMWLEQDLANAQTSTSDEGNFAFIQQAFQLEQNLSPQEIARYANLLKVLIQNFCDKSPDLLRLGTIFQKKKIEEEKLSIFIEKNSSRQNISDKLLQQVYALDKELDIIQQIIYHWVQDGMSKLLDFVKKKTLSEIHVEAFAPSPPQFLQNEKYNIDSFGINQVHAVQKVNFDDLLTDPYEIRKILSAIELSFRELF